MLAVVKEISTVSGTPLTYVLIHIWISKKDYDQGDEPSGDNQFIMDLHKTQERRVRDSQGRHRTLEGKYVHPSRVTGDEDWEMDTYHIDVSTEIMANVCAYLDRRKKAERTKNPYPAFHAQPAVVRTRDNPRSILTMTGVQNLVGKVVTVK